MSPQAAQTTAPETPEETPDRRKARIEGVKKLIQQASSPQGDGEVAARRACALIRKFGLDIVDPALIDDLHKENHLLKVKLEAAVRGDVDLDDLDTMFGQGNGPFVQPPHNDPFFDQFGGVGRPSKTGKKTTWASAAPPPPPPPKPKPKPIPVPVLLQASQFAARCLQCNTEHAKGTSVKWLKGVGTWCPATSCYNDWYNKSQANAQAAAGFDPFGP